MFCSLLTKLLEEIMNRLTLVGRIVREVVLKDIGDGKFVINNVIAVSRHYRSDKQPDTDFIPFVAWGKRAELIEEYCEKGDMIGLDGRIQSRTYQNSADETKYVVEMNVDAVQFLQPKKEESYAKI